MKRGEQFKRIFNLLSQGKKAKEIIAMGFPKASVYWALNRYKNGEVPTERAKPVLEWLTIYRQRGLIHDCKDGRTGIIEDDELMTDEGIVKMKVCNSCDEIIESHMERWLPEVAERYQRFKKTGATGFDALAQLGLLRASLGRHF